MYDSIRFEWRFGSSSHHRIHTRILSHWPCNGLRVCARARAKCCVVSRVFNGVTAHIAHVMDTAKIDMCSLVRVTRFGGFFFPDLFRRCLECPQCQTQTSYHLISQVIFLRWCALWRQSQTATVFTCRPSVLCVSATTKRDAKRQTYYFVIKNVRPETCVLWRACSMWNIHILSTRRQKRMHESFGTSAHMCSTTTKYDRFNGGKAYFHGSRRHCWIAFDQMIPSIIWYFFFFARLILILCDANNICCVRCPIAN